MKTFEIIDMINGQAVDTVSSNNGKNALRKFRRCLLSTGFYEYHKLESGIWELSASYGRYFQAREKKSQEQK